MKSHRSNKGFGVIEALLLLVLAGLVGFVGWYVVKQGNDKSQISDNYKSPDTKQTKAKKEEATPATSKYENKELGFQFTYPQSWGTAKLDKENGIKGTNYRISFSKEENSSFQAWSKDYEPAGLGGGCMGVYPVNSYEPFQALKDTDGFRDVKVNENGFSVVYLGADNGDSDFACPAVMIARKKISSNTLIGSVDFRFF